MTEPSPKELLEGLFDLLGEMVRSNGGYGRLLCDSVGCMKLMCCVVIVQAARGRRRGSAALAQKRRRATLQFVVV